MKIGDTVHNAIWTTGDEPAEMRAHYEKQVRDSISFLCDENGFVCGGFKTSEHLPDTDLSKFLKEPKVPDHIQGSKVRLLVIESDVVDTKSKVEIGSFVHNLDKADLHKLRHITRKAYAKHHKQILSNAECDEVIEQLGVDAALETLRDM